MRSRVDLGVVISTAPVAGGAEGPQAFSGIVIGGESFMGKFDDFRGFTGLLQR